MHRYLILILLILFLQNLHSQNVSELFQKMLEKNKQIQTLKYTLVMAERIDGKMYKQKFFIKFNRNPFNVYYKQEYPYFGAEVLFISGANNNKAIINPNRFPWFNIYLDPFSDIMRKNQHHTIYDVGFDYTFSILEYLMKKYEKNISSLIKIIDTIIWNGIPCYKIQVENPDFKYSEYIVKEGETLTTIAKKFKINDYMILEKNKLRDYDAVVAGQKIIIPNDYAKKLVLYLDKQKMLPVFMQIYDDVGLYEQYEYYNLEINPIISPEEFTKNYKGYGF